MKWKRVKRSVGSLVAVAAIAGVTGAVFHAHAAEPAAEPGFSATDLAFFEKEVRPILVENCFKCHNDKKQKGGLRMDARSLVVKGGEHGPAVNPNAPEKSVILHAIGYTDEDMQMPPDGKLPQAKIDILTKWTRAGAPWTPGQEAVAVAGEPVKINPDTLDPEKNREGWAYKPRVRPAVPKMADAQLSAWSKNPVDAFIAAKLAEKGLKPNAAADRIALIRRAFYDLVGLAPTPAEIDAFVADRSPQAWEKLIDRLLASPQYGEKWGRHWLDLVRYAETNGYERDGAKPQAWRYRDYVIRSFNTDKPYNQFLKEQIAGDELDQVTTDTMIATGYYRLGIWDDEPADRPQARYDVLDGVVSTTSSVVLGMSVGCARCHDHKRDPIPQKDYYKLLAFFQDVSDMNSKNLKPVADEAARQEFARVHREKAEAEGKLYQEQFGIEQAFLKASEAKGLPAVRIVGNDLTDLTYKFYRDTWETLPDFDALKPEATGDLAGNLITLAPASRTEAIGLVFEARLKVPVTGEYTFHLNATEGVRLLVAGKAIVNHPGKGHHADDAKATLPAGFVPVRLEYFNAYAKPSLDLAWSGTGFDHRSLSQAAGSAGAEKVLVADARQGRQTWQYTTEATVGDWAKPAFAAEKWKTGIGGFGSKGVPGGVVNTPWRTPEIWMRQTFNLDAVPANLALDVHHDEDIEVFLNGTRVYDAKGHLRDYKRVQLGEEAASLLKPGVNLLAVYGRNTVSGQYMDVGLVEERAGANLVQLIAAQGEGLIGKAKTQRHAELLAMLASASKVKPVEAGVEVMCVFESSRNRPTHVLIRGNPASEGDEVQPGFPRVLTAPGADLPTLPASSAGASGGKRRILAEWLASPDNPATARVMANRLFQYHFGRGLVPSPSDFGRLGDGCTHPELMDWLASELVEGGWTLKRMHKLLMTSNTYQMSSHANDEGLKADPGNNLFWRFNMRRLGAEEVRDSILAASGKLNLTMGGPSVYPVISKAVLAGQSRPGAGWGKSTADEASRRSVYVHVKRSLLVPILATHDQADTDSSCPVRFTTTVPTQSLGMLNGEFTNEQAGFLADRVRNEMPGDIAEQVKRAIRLTAGRSPTDQEVKADLAFLAKMKAEQQLNDADALRLYCLMLLNTNEFIYLD